jgi:topoisomerase-4 subunit A
LEITSIEKELDDVRKLIDHLRGILGSEMKLLGVIKKELREIREQFGIDRRSEIQDEVEELKVSLEVMVTPEDVLVTLSDEGYIKRTSKLSFTRSGGEIEKTGLKEGDFVRELLEVNTIDTLLLFTDKGQYFVLPVHAVPEYKWKDNGTALVNVVPIAKEDRIVAVIPVKDMQEVGRTLLFATKRGQIKRSELKEYATNRTTAIAAVKLGDGDEVIAVWLDTPASTDILVVTKLGMSIRFSGQEVNTMGRVAAGVRAISLKEGDEVAAALPVKGDEGEVLVLSDLGYAKSSLLADYSLQGRGGKGISTFEFKEGKRVKPNGNALVCAVYVREAVGFVAVTKSGKTSGFSSEAVPITDLRATGSSVVALEKGDEVVALVSLKVEG